MVIKALNWWLDQLTGGAEEVPHKGPVLLAQHGEDGVQISDIARRRSRPVTVLDHANTTPSALKPYPPPRTRIIVPVESSKVLNRPVELPSAAIENLRQVLYLQMEKVTPFGADDVVFSGTVQRPGKGEQPMLVTLQVAPRRLVQLERDALQRAGFTLPWEWARVETYQDGIAVVFTPPRQRRALLSANLLVWALNIILVGTLLAWPWWEQHQALTQLEAQMAPALEEAQKVAELRSALDTLTEERQLLSKLGYQPPSATQLLEEIASRLPNGTWLRQFTIKSGKLTLIGMSPQAPQLLKQLEASRWLKNVQFAAALRVVQGQTDGEQFVIEATIVRGEEH